MSRVRKFGQFKMTSFGQFFWGNRSKKFDLERGQRQLRRIKPRRGGLLSQVIGRPFFLGLMLQYMTHLLIWGNT